MKNMCCDKVEQKSSCRDIEIGLWRTLYVRERSLYLMRSFILSQCRDLRTGVMGEDVGVLVTAQARELWMFWNLFI